MSVYYYDAANDVELICIDPINTAPPSDEDDPLIDDRLFSQTHYDGVNVLHMSADPFDIIAQLEEESGCCLALS